MFSIVAIATLGLGIGVNTAIFSAAKHALRPDLPFTDSDRLVRIYQVPEPGGPTISPRTPVFLSVRDASDAFESVAASRFTDLTLMTPDGPERVIGNVVTPGWLGTLGVQPIVGRGFTPEEEAVGLGSRAAVISHSMWQRRFGGDAGVAGSVLRLNGDPYTVVGVLPPGFNYPYNAEVWLPFRPEDDSGEAFWALNMKARLSPSATLAGAREELRNLSAEIGGQLPGFSVGMTLHAVPIRETLVGEEGRTVSALTAAVGFLLLVVCANLANLLLSRALTREPEFALRSSLGASRGRLLRQALVESLALGVAGGAAGIAIAYLGIDLLRPLLPDTLFTLGAGIALDAPVLLFAIGISVTTGLVLGVVPALRLSSASPIGLLRSGAQSVAGPRKRKLADTLVVAELAVTLMLLTGVGLMVRDFQRQQSRDLGYDQEGLMVFSVSLDREPYLDGARRVQFTQQLIAELTAAPEISAAGGTTMFPRHRGNMLARLMPEGSTQAPENLPTVNHRVVVSGYLQGLEARLLSGRWIENTDRDGTTPVALVNASLARRFWPTEDPLGKRLRNQRAGDEAPWHTVVGLIDEIREADDIAETWYVPYAQNADGRSAAQLTFAVRGARAGAIPSIGTIRDALRRVDPELPVFEATTVDMLNFESLGRERYGAMLGSAFGAFGLLLAALGIYGSVSYTVATRMREFGLRMALGSDRRMILNDVLGQVGRWLAIGCGLGFVGALGVARVLGANLSEIGAFDPMAFAAAVALLTGSAVAAGALPAWRATRADPMKALRAD